MFSNRMREGRPRSHASKWVTRSCLRCVSRTERFQQSILIVISGVGQGERGQNREKRNHRSPRVRLVPVQVPVPVSVSPLGVQGWHSGLRTYTSRTRKPRRVRLQTEFACKTRSPSFPAVCDPSLYNAERLLEHPCRIVRVSSPLCQPWNVAYENFSGILKNITDESNSFEF